MPQAKQAGVFWMSASMIRPVASGRIKPSGTRVASAFPAIVLLLCASLLVALETLSKPFLDKNSFYLSSAGFRVQLANDAAGKKTLHALPPHRFVMHQAGDSIRYFYAEPQHCVCIFVGMPAAYEAYRNMLSQPLEQADNVAPDYKSQASALLNGTPVLLNTLNEPDDLIDYFRAYY
jgi:hypothetical protein